MAVELAPIEARRAVCGTQPRGSRIEPPDERSQLLFDVEESRDFGRDELGGSFRRRLKRFVELAAGRGPWRAPGPPERWWSAQARTPAPRTPRALVRQADRPPGRECLRPLLEASWRADRAARASPRVLGVPVAGLRCESCSSRRDPRSRRRASRWRSRPAAAAALRAVLPTSRR
jgi:hypothetical protein